MRNNFVLRWIIPKKRIGRLEFAERMVVALLVMALLIRIFDYTDSPLIVLLWLIVLWIFSSWHISRLHDIGKSISGRWLGIILCIFILIALNIDLILWGNIDEVYSGMLMFGVSTALPIVVLHALLLTVPGNTRGNRQGPAPEEYNGICKFLFSKFKWTTIEQRQITKPHSKLRGIYGSSLKTRVVCWTLCTLVLLGEIIIFTLVSGILWEKQAKKIDRLLSARSLNRAILYDVAWAADMWMEMGVDLSYLDKHGLTPIHYAARTGNTKIVEKLLEADVDPHIRSQSRREYGRTPMHVAAHHGRAEIIEVLLEAGADPNAQDADMKTPLHYASDTTVQKRNLEVIKILIRAGADPNAQDTYKNMPLHHIAQGSRNLDIIKVLLEAGADPNARDADMRTPLYLAANSEKIVEVLLDAGADPNAQDSDMDTPLHRAATGGGRGIKLLIRAGADPNAQNRYMEAPLFWAVRSRNLYVVKAFLEAGADPNAQSSDMDTPLIWAVRRRNLDVVKALLEAGADPNAQNADMETPLHEAVGSKNLDIIKTLMIFGSHVHIKNRRGETPLDKAIRLERIEIIEILYKTGSQK